MNFLTDAFYWITTGLLVPVMVLLLLGFVYALICLAGFYGFYADRTRYRKEIHLVLNEIDTAGVDQISWRQSIKHNPLFLAALESADRYGWDESRSCKALADFEMEAERALEKLRLLMRTGPMLGLMGTLIPMGPALVGLANGDIAAMATNMQIAFSTTVIGIFLGVVGFATYTVRKRWFSEDLYTLNFIFESAEGNCEA